MVSISMRPTGPHSGRVLRCMQRPTPPLVSIHSATSGLVGDSIGQCCVRVRAGCLSRAEWLNSLHSSAPQGSSLGTTNAR